MDSRSAARRSAGPIAGLHCRGGCSRPFGLVSRKNLPSIHLVPAEPAAGADMTKPPHEGIHPLLSRLEPRVLDVNSSSLCQCGRNLFGKRDGLKLWIRAVCSRHRSNENCFDFVPVTLLPWNFERGEEVPEIEEFIVRYGVFKNPHPQFSVGFSDVVGVPRPCRGHKLPAISVSL